MSLYVPYYRPYNKHNTNIHALGGIRTHDPSKRAALDPHLRPHGHWDRHRATLRFMFVFNCINTNSITCFQCKLRSRISSVTIVTTLGEGRLGNLGSISDMGEDFSFLFLFCIVQVSLVSPLDTGIISPGVRRPGHEADHSPICNAEFMNEWSYTSHIPIHLCNCTV
jgi:hypothetical protein